MKTVITIQVDSDVHRALKFKSVKLKESMSSILIGMMKKDKDIKKFLETKEAIVCL